MTTTQAATPLANLYIEGHSKKLGYAITPCFSDNDCSRLPIDFNDDAFFKPRRFLQSATDAKRLVERFNRVQERRRAALAKAGAA